VKKGGENNKKKTSVAGESHATIKGNTAPAENSAQRKQQPAGARRICIRQPQFLAGMSIQSIFDHELFGNLGQALAPVRVAYKVKSVRAPLPDNLFPVPFFPERVPFSYPPEMRRKHIPRCHRHRPGNQPGNARK
jgi:hypothetical protein